MAGTSMVCGWRCATARTSLVLFALAFTASAMVELLPSEATRWQRRNRRYLGVSFAISHFIHLGVILALAVLDRELFWKLTNVTTIVLAGAAYLFIAAMTATSFDRSAAWLGPRKWRLLHVIGGWYIWISFAVAVAVGKRACAAPPGRAGAPSLPGAPPTPSRDRRRWQNRLSKTTPASIASGPADEPVAAIPMRAGKGPTGASLLQGRHRPASRPDLPRRLHRRGTTTGTG